MKLTHGFEPLPPDFLRMKKKNLLGAPQSTQFALPGMSDLSVLIACRSIMLVLEPPLALDTSLPYRKKLG